MVCTACGSSTRNQRHNAERQRQRTRIQRAMGDALNRYHSGKCTFVDGGDGGVFDVSEVVRAIHEYEQLAVASGDSGEGNGRAMWSNILMSQRTQKLIEDVLSCQLQDGECFVVTKFQRGGKVRRNDVKAVAMVRAHLQVARCPSL
jgi:hypothetical protein